MADSNAGDVLFQRGQNSDENEDIWDDTALIKAYDEAVSLMKNKVAQQNGVLESGNEETAGLAKNLKKKKKRTKNKRKQRKWHVGDSCRAKFSEDGVIYEAEVISLDETAGTCCVRYVGYGNEEEQELENLLPQQRKKKKESDVDTDSGMDWKESKRSGNNKLGPGMSQPHMFPLPGWPGFPESMMPPPPPNFPGFPTAPTAMPHTQSAFSSSRLPNIPPPPPPPMLSEMSEGDNEALCSMLMSWYMSGYHTGFYLGLQQGRKASTTSSPFVNR